MASIKDLKKDINFLATEIISECYFRMLIIENADKSELTNVVTNAVNFRSEFLKRANHTDGKSDRKIVKAYYQALRKDMFEKFSAMAETIARQK